MDIERLRWLPANEDKLREHGISRDEVDAMIRREDAKGWRVIGVGKRHPRWLEFEIAAIAYRNDPAGLVGEGVPADVYRPAARIVAERLRERDPTSTAPENVSRLMHETFAGFYAGRLTGDESIYRTMAEEIQAAWRAYAARMAEAPTA